MRVRGCGKGSHWSVRILSKWLYDWQGEVIDYGAPVPFAANVSKRLGAFKSGTNNLCQDSALLSSPKLTKRGGREWTD